MKRGLSQEALAASAGLDRTFISMVERGVRRPTLDSAKRIADALNVSLVEVIRSVER
jgi:transcriptional regulator with XRE-family HTH domain